MEGAREPQPAKVRTTTLSGRWGLGPYQGPLGPDHKGGPFAIQGKKQQINKGSAGHPGGGRVWGRPPPSLCPLKEPDLHSPGPPVAPGGPS